MQDRHKNSFPYRSIETWNKLDAEVINAIFMISKANWIIADLETGQYEHNSFPVCYN